LTHNSRNVTIIDINVKIQCGVSMTAEQPRDDNITIKGVRLAPGAVADAMYSEVEGRADVERRVAVWMELAGSGLLLYGRPGDDGEEEQLQAVVGVEHPEAEPIDGVDLTCAGWVLLGVGAAVGLLSWRHRWLASKKLKEGVPPPVASAILEADSGQIRRKYGSDQGGNPAPDDSVTTLSFDERKLLVSIASGEGSEQLCRPIPRRWRKDANKPVKLAQNLTRFADSGLE
jgi:hypothetical protein